MKSIMKNIAGKIEEHKILCLVIAFVLTLALRFAVKHNTFGDLVNFYESGQIAASGRNIYVYQTAYNYGFIFAEVLGVLYRAASFFPDDFAAFRTLMIIMLTLVDLFTAFIIVKKAGTVWGIVFLFTPQAVWVASRNYQFNNIAVLLAFLGVLCIEDSAGERRITLRDIAGTLLLSLSLIMKHILWMFPMWILFSTKTDARKKILYAIIPPLLFFLSFVPYWSEGSQGIIQHVFMYRAGNNFPLLGVGLLNKYGIILPYQGNLCLAVFGLLMILGAYIFRHEKIFNLFLVYLIAQVCFSSGISVTFLAIPAASLIIIFRKWSLIYFALGVITRLLVRGNVATAVSMYENNIARIGMFMPMVWCLLAYLVYYYFRRSEKAPRVL